MSAPLLARSSELPTICGIQLAFTGRMIPSDIPGCQEFYNTLPEDTDFTDAYFGRGSVAFSEGSEESSSGTSYRQQLRITFPGSDSARADRLAFFQKAKFVKILLSNSLHIVIGRNDFEQNARPKIKTETDHRTATVTFETLSVFPSGYTPAPGGLPSLIPIDLNNDD
ncbi:hypothetical protein ACLI09_08590 [Flavobacterium sp. RHBU_24]|uniref:hypothetical protein n=1 Tax=Flavobacterium sp. RHBU_24 TaxID=3391185 RepID=UPI003985175A